MTVLPWSGEAVVCGQVSEDAPWALYIYGLAESGQELQKVREMEAPCQHNIPGLLGVTVEGEGFLSVTCGICSSVALVDLSSGEKKVAYQGGGGDSDFRPVRVCQRDPGKLWMLEIQDTDSGNKYEMKELDCSSSSFTPTGKGFPIEAMICLFVCYLPAPYNALVYPNAGTDVLLSVDCESGERLWELKGEVDGAEINPAGVTFSPQHQLLLVADLKNKRILVVDPGSGSHLQSLPLPGEMMPMSLSLHNEHLYVMGAEESEEKLVLSCFSLT